MAKRPSPAPCSTRLKRQTRTVAFLSRGARCATPLPLVTPIRMRRRETGRYRVACSYVLAPGLPWLPPNPILDLTSNLDKLFALIAERRSEPGGDLLSERKSGVYRQYPWRSEDPMDSLEFTLDRSLAQELNRGGEIPEPLRRAFRQNGMDLSRHAVVSTTDPGNNWVIRDDERQTDILRAAGRNRSGRLRGIRPENRALVPQRSWPGRRGVDQISRLGLVGTGGSLCSQSERISRDR